MAFTFQKMCAMLAAKNCYEDGQEISEIAKSAKKSPAVIRRWLKGSGTRMRKVNYDH